MRAKYFLRIHLFEEIIAELAIYYMDMKNKQHSGICNKCNIVKRAKPSNATSELTGNLELSFFCLYLLNNVIKITSQSHKMNLNLVVWHSHSSMQNLPSSYISWQWMKTGERKSRENRWIAIVLKRKKVYMNNKLLNKNYKPLLSMCMDD